MAEASQQTDAQTEGVELLQQLLSRAAEDAGLRQQLLDQPAATMRKAGIAVPDEVRVEAHEMTARERHYVLPPHGAAGLPTDLEVVRRMDPVVGPVLARAWEDEGYKARLLAEPRAAIQEVLGFTPADGVNVHIYENSPEHVHLVLPLRTAQSANGELSDAELDQVAGGKWTDDALNAVNTALTLANPARLLGFGLGVEVAAVEAVQGNSSLAGQALQQATKFYTT